MNSAVWRLPFFPFGFEFGLCREAFFLVHGHHAWIVEDVRRVWFYKQPAFLLAVHGIDGNAMLARLSARWRTLPVATL